MIFGVALSEIDKARAERTIRKLAGHDISRWALTGGLATEIYIVRCGGPFELRPLHDIDFIVPSFDCIPQSLSKDFLMRHVHPGDPPGKTLLQCVDEETGVRVDVFRAYGSVMNRVHPIEGKFERLPMISMEDLTARAARLSWNLCEGQPVAPKYVRDFLRLMELSTTEAVESAWQDHRQAHRPESFETAVAEIRRALAARPELLVSPVYSTDPNAVCERCVGSEGLPLAEANRILAILGYC
ncbi:hypothetical protein RBB75_12865 [Tunturibacter empetritectus]|uniref:Nucleotidyl transferase AbiEii/AbiGii toxin family protein n=1 Tax=Tunturiibacter empetritectus TaxID=3069691 RepID=A0AAU7Z9B6_9BACT